MFELILASVSFIKFGFSGHQIYLLCGAIFWLAGTVSFTVDRFFSRLCKLCDYVVDTMKRVDSEKKETQKKNIESLMTLMNIINNNYNKSKDKNKDEE